MGGIGSGRTFPDRRRLTSETPSLGVTPLDREGNLAPGAESRWRCQRGNTVTRFSVSATDNGATISHSWRDDSGEARTTSEFVAVSRSPRNRGGAEAYWVCPACQRRVKRVYLVGHRLRCRFCHRLCYPSQREGQIDRTIRRATSLRARMGGSLGYATPLPERTKWRHRSTYHRQMGALVNATLDADKAMGRRLTILEKSIRRSLRPLRRRSRTTPVDP